jgi:hypothetical protein
VAWSRLLAEEDDSDDKLGIRLLVSLDGRSIDGRREGRMLK